MTIYDRIKSDLNVARKRGNKLLANDLKVIMGEFARLKGTKDGKSYITDSPNDIQAERVLNSIIKSEEKTMSLTGSSSSTLLEEAKKYIPEKISEEEIKDYIDTIDFSSLKNKMQAVGIVKKHFGSKVDGKMVSNLIRGM